MSVRYILQMTQAEALRWAETCSARIDSLKSLFLELKKLNTANVGTAMVVVDLKKIERDVSQGYDQFVDAFKHFRTHLNHSILELENSENLGAKEPMPMNLKADDEEECIENREQRK